MAMSSCVSRTAAALLAVALLAPGSVLGQAVTRPAADPSTATRDPAGTEADWRIARERVRWARETGLDTLPFGELMAAVGETFLGTDYVPRTLEVPGPERLVVNLEQLDCVTFVENALALAHLAATLADDVLSDSTRFQQAFRGTLTRIRYRGGVLDGYGSRLHYFSEWIADNQALGLVQDVTAELGGIPDDEPVDFMSTHPDAYPQLSDPGALATVREAEARLSGSARHVIPKSEIRDREAGIRTGDIIAATSTVAGLDVAHTGIAVWKGGALHLMHAPLVGRSVELSPLPLADRIQGIRSQDGIMVARPVPPLAH